LWFITDRHPQSSTAGIAHNTDVATQGRRQDRGVTSSAFTHEPSSLARRRNAGSQLATWLIDLIDLTGERPVVVGIAPDGMPLAAEIADALGAPLETVAVESLAVGPGCADRFGVAAEGGIAFFDPDRRDQVEAEPAAVDASLIETEADLQRRSQLWHGGHRPRSLRGRTVLLVSELLADERSAAAAACAVRDRGAARIVFVTCRAGMAAVQAMNEWVDEIVDLELLDDETAATDCHQDTSPVADATVRELLCKNRDERPQAQRRRARP
jgi:putative phosphoribosyl transferase